MMGSFPAPICLMAEKKASNNAVEDQERHEIFVRVAFRKHQVAPPSRTVAFWRRLLHPPPLQRAQQGDKQR